MLTSVALALTVAVIISMAQDPYEEPNRSWITLTGTVVSADPDSFMLDYGEGLVIVEMDDGDWYKDGSSVIEGDEVRVSGLVDDDIFETTTIEASHVYVKGLNTYFSQGHWRDGLRRF